MQEQMFEQDFQDKKQQQKIQPQQQLQDRDKEQSSVQIPNKFRTAKKQIDEVLMKYQQVKWAYILFTQELFIEKQEGSLNHKYRKSKEAVNKFLCQKFRIQKQKIKKTSFRDGGFIIVDVIEFDQCRFVIFHRKNLETGKIDIKADHQDEKIYCEFLFKALIVKSQKISLILITAKQQINYFRKRGTNIEYLKQFQTAQINDHLRVKFGIKHSSRLKCTNEQYWKHFNNIQKSQFKQAITFLEVQNDGQSTNKLDKNLFETLNKPDMKFIQSRKILEFDFHLKLSANYIQILEYFTSSLRLISQCMSKIFKSLNKENQSIENLIQRDLIWNKSLIYVAIEYISVLKKVQNGQFRDILKKIFEIISQKQRISLQVIEKYSEKNNLQMEGGQSNNKLQPLIKIYLCKILTQRLGSDNIMYFMSQNKIINKLSHPQPQEQGELQSLIEPIQIILQLILTYRGYGQILKQRRCDRVIIDAIIVVLYFFFQKNKQKMEKRQIPSIEQRYKIKDVDGVNGGFVGLLEEWIRLNPAKYDKINLSLKSALFESRITMKSIKECLDIDKVYQDQRFLKGINIGEQFQGIKISKADNNYKGVNASQKNGENIDSLKEQSLKLQKSQNVQEDRSSVEIQKKDWSVLKQQQIKQSQKEYWGWQQSKKDIKILGNLLDKLSNEQDNQNRYKNSSANLPNNRSFVNSNLLKSQLNEIENQNSHSMDPFMRQLSSEQSDMIQIKVEDSGFIGNDSYGSRLEISRIEQSDMSGLKRVNQEEQIFEMSLNLEESNLEEKRDNMNVIDSLNERSFSGQKINNEIHTQKTKLIEKSLNTNYNSKSTQSSIYLQKSSFMRSYDVDDDLDEILDSQSSMEEQNSTRISRMVEEEEEDQESDDDDY